ncbi:LysR family transcriptional regulator [Denitratisoma sp. agr-D3]
MNKLEAMKVFVRVAELASFTQAADQLGLPKASVSEAIKQLENLFGTRLLQRTTRSVQTTHDGLLCYERCKSLLEEMDELEGLFQQGSETLEGRLRVDMPLGVADHIVIPRLPEFLQAHPRLEVAIGSTDRRVDLVQEGFDCVLRVGKLSDSTLVARPLGHFPMMNCASPDYLARHGVPRRLADLGKHQLVHYATAPGEKSPGFEYADGGETRFIPMSGQVTVNNSTAYRSACLAGLGLVQIPRVGNQGLIDDGLALEVLPKYRPLPMPVSLLVPNRRHLPKRVQAFMTWLQGVMAPHLA